MEKSTIILKFHFSIITLQDTEMTIRETALLQDLLYKMEDCEAQLSDSLYDEMYEVYNEECEEE